MVGKMVDMDIGDGEENKKRWIKWLVLVLAMANLFVWLAIFDNGGRKMAEVWFFDVGQGDAEFIQLPNGVQVLIDGGPNGAVLDKLGQAMPFYDRDIDWLILSHTDRDHLAGVLLVLQNYRVKNILWSGIGDDDAEDNEWRRLIKEEGASIKIARAGEKLQISDDPKTFLEILAPAQNERGLDKSQNEFSAVVKLVCGRRSFLFPGDAPSAVGGFADNASFEQADVLKAAHHGSKYSTASGFLVQTLPAAAVISAGAGNPYGHPHQETLDLLAKYDIKTLRTDQSGDIEFRTDGERIFLITEK
jgi:competence protein ComEC